MLLDPRQQFTYLGTGLFCSHSPLGNQVIGSRLELAGPLIGGLAHTVDELIATAACPHAKLTAAIRDQFACLLTRLGSI